MQSVLAFTAFAAVLTLTPGLDTMLALRTTAASGRAAGLAAVVGICVGCLIWATASAVGVTAVLATSRVAFEVLRIAGVAYLLWLGIRALWSARRSVAPLPTVYGAKSNVISSFRTGLVTNLLNPKVGAFYLSVLPQFLPGGLDPLLGSLLLGSIHVVEGLLWLSVIVLAVNRARAWLTRPAVRRRLEQAAGLTFLGFGIKLALSPPLR